MKQLSSKQFQKKVLAWFQDHGRTDLPWQQNVNAYRVWISEIMLQQTQVNTVIPYFQRFMERFPHVADLADATEDEVLHLWTGLGYYARARNLHRCSQLIMQEYAGQFPEDVDTLTSLPGIGRSTAGAIISLAWQKPATILDGNVKRVLCRYFAIEGWPGKTAVHKHLWQVAESLTPKQDCHQYTQAMMDLGATLCTRSQPQCTRCPLNKSCQAYQQQNPTAYPTAKPKRTIPTKTTYMILLQNKHGDILLEKRPPVGIWGGLWSLPQCDDMQQLATWSKQHYACKIGQWQQQPSFRHTFSHFHLEITPIIVSVLQWSPPLRDDQDHCWYSPQQPMDLGLAAPVKRLLDELASIT